MSPAWLALVGQATTDVAPGQYGIASGIFKTSTHMGASVAVDVFATTIDFVGSDTPGDGSAHATAYLAATALTVSGAGATGLLIHGSRSRQRPDLHRGPA